MGRRMTAREKYEKALKDMCLLLQKLEKVTPLDNVKKTILLHKKMIALDRKAILLSRKVGPIWQKADWAEECEKWGKLDTGLNCNVHFFPLGRMSRRK